MKKHDFRKENLQLFESGFTLVELMVVIAIISVMASVVTINMKSSVDKSKRTSALTTASSVLPELVTCADDNGYARSTTRISSGHKICCTDANCASDTFVQGHKTNWPDVVAKTGWDYDSVAPTGTVQDGNFVFKLKKTGETDIVCDMAKNDCV